MQILINFGDAYYDDSYQGSAEDCRFLENYINGRDADLEQLRETIAVRPIKPWNILAITFTNKAAGELKERLRTLLGEDGDNINAATFHSACVRILRREIDKLGYRAVLRYMILMTVSELSKACMNELGVSEKTVSAKICFV